MNFRKLNKILRDDVEKDLTFVGLLIMQNKLKPASRYVINELKKAKIHTLMITGDNILTAISVARECSIVNPNQRIFLGEVDSLPNGEKTINWQDFDFTPNQLDPETLLPVLESPDESLNNTICKHSHLREIL